MPVKNLSLKRLLNKSKKLDSRRLAVLHESGSLHLLLVDKQRIVARKKTACDIAALNESVREFMNEQQLSDIAATIVLGLNSYQMLLVEAPPVEAEELAAALKWKVKDLLSQKVDQSIVDGFLLPDDAFRGRQKMAYAVATEKQAQQNLVDTLAEVGVLVDSIQVPELLLLQALKNVLSAGQAELVMVIGASGGMLVAIADGAVYLSRKLDVSADTVSEENSEQSQQVIDKLVLEMQRSRDYFESQMGKGIVGRLLLMPGVSAAMATQLNEQTGIKTQLLAASELYTQSASDLFLNAEDTLMAAALNAA